MSERPENEERARDLERFRVQYARASLGLIVLREAEHAAVGLLGAGFDGQSLRLLASSSLDPLTELRGLVLAAAEEVGVAPLTDAAAILVLVQDRARTILAGRCSPYAGASAILELSQLGDGPRSELYDPFVYAASEWEDRPEDRQHLDREIVQEADRFLRRGHPTG